MFNTVVYLNIRVEQFKQNLVVDFLRCIGSVIFLYLSNEEFLHVNQFRLLVVQYCTHLFLCNIFPKVIKPTIEFNIFIVEVFAWIADI